MENAGISRKVDITNASQYQTDVMPVCFLVWFKLYKKVAPTTRNDPRKYMLKKTK